MFYSKIFCFLQVNSMKWNNQDMTPSILNNLHFWNVELNGLHLQNGKIRMSADTFESIVGLQKTVIYLEKDTTLEFYEDQLMPPTRHRGQSVVADIISADNSKQVRKNNLFNNYLFIGPYHQTIL